MSDQEQPPSIIDDAAAAKASPTPSTSASCTPPLLPHRSDPALLESFHYINSMPGKNVRGTMIDCFQLWFQIQENDNDNSANNNNTNVLDAIKEIVGDLHNASLMIDDIEDNSKLRRGCPVAHSIFGIPTVINSANYAYFLALEKCHALHNAQAMQVFVGRAMIYCGETMYDVRPRNSTWKWFKTKRGDCFDLRLD
jgi:geranylgeranyl diphosphate synthase, type III